MRGRILVLVGVVVAMLLVAGAAWKLGSWSRDAQVKNLALRLDTEAKKATGWWKAAETAKVSDQKSQSALKAKDAEIASKTVVLEDCEKKMAKLSNPPKAVAVARRAPALKPAVASVAPAMPPEKKEAPAPVPGPVPVPAPVPVPIPALAVAAISPPMSKFYTLRINVIEWDQSTFGRLKTLYSRDVGPAIRKGIAKGAIKLATIPITFQIEWWGTDLGGKTVTINGREVKLPENFANGSVIELIAHNGQATIAVDPSVITAGTVIRVRAKDEQMASPPDGLSLETVPGELEAQKRVSKWQDIFLNFILAIPVEDLKGSSTPYFVSIINIMETEAGSK